MCNSASRIAASVRRTALMPIFLHLTFEYRPSTTTDFIPHTIVLTTTSMNIRWTCLHLHITIHHNDDQTQRWTLTKGQMDDGFTAVLELLGDHDGSTHLR
jgi:hypothetical protein